MVIELIVGWIIVAMLEKVVSQHESLLLTLSEHQLRHLLPTRLVASSKPLPRCRPLRKLPKKRQKIPKKHEGYLAPIAVFDGFLLGANLDALFDCILISFTGARELLGSSSILLGILALLGLNRPLRLRWLVAEHQP